MKQALRRELTNIVFLILIVASAVVIYLLSRAENGESATTAVPEAAATQGVQTETLQTELDETPAPTSAAEATASARGVPEAVFQTHLATSGVYFAKQRGNEKQYEITYGEKETITADMTYQLELNEQERGALLRLLDVAVKGGGLVVAEAAVVLAKKIDSARRVEPEAAPG